MSHIIQIKENQAKQGQQISNIDEKLDKVMDKQDSHEEEINKLKGFKNRVIGYLVAASAAGGTAGTIANKLLGIFP